METHSNRIEENECILITSLCPPHILITWCLPSENGCLRIRRAYHIQNLESAMQTLECKKKHWMHTFHKCCQMGRMHTLRSSPYSFRDNISEAFARILPVSGVGGTISVMCAGSRDPSYEKRPQTGRSKLALGCVMWQCLGGCRGFFLHFNRGLP